MFAKCFLCMNNMRSLEADQMQQQKRTLGTTQVSKGQVTEARVHNESLKLHINKVGKKVSWSEESQFQLQHSDGRVRIGLNKKALLIGAYIRGYFLSKLCVL
ncbi:hypothetical protein CHARACLAT_008629 [Characodon lateralis]|uniref:Uncharacterized protein n=1 Tax=Characodon lateralis TaxID=208331 RepID=A0ABU7F1X1_9TELE|nr:hypothetical protein [Characodon lateralis]